MTHYQNISIKSSKTYPCLTFKVLNLKTKKQNNNNNNKNVFGRFLGLLEIAWLEGYFCFLEVFSREQLHWGSREKRGQLFMAQNHSLSPKTIKISPGVILNRLAQHVFSVDTWIGKRHPTLVHWWISHMSFRFRFLVQSRRCNL